MLRRLLARKKSSPVPQELYGAVVAQARHPAFFTRFGVADSVTGRFDMVCLHLYLLTRRLAGRPEQHAAALAQDVFDIFTRELDSALRELGVGDTSVARRMKRMLGAYYALIEKMGPELDRGDFAAAGGVASERFTPEGAAERAMAPALFGSFIAQAVKRLEAVPYETIATGSIDWPDPDAAADGQGA